VLAGAEGNCLDLKWRKGQEATENYITMRGYFIDGNKLEAEEMGEVCGTRGREKEEHRFEYKGVGGKIMIQFVFKKLEY
jgi:hypothetical protein